MKNIWEKSFRLNLFLKYACSYIKEIKFQP